MKTIRDTLIDLAHRPASLGEKGRAVLEALGYSSPRTFDTTDRESFLTLLYGNASVPLDRKAACVEQWRDARFIFQLTGAELTNGDGPLLSETQPPDLHVNSYLFVAVRLKAKRDRSPYTRGELVALTRALNRPLSIPVFVLLLHGPESDPKLSLAIIHRRAAKRRTRLHAVLEKVSLVKDISLASPCRAHLEILRDLSLDAVRETAKSEACMTFEAVHRQWIKALATKPLNEKFYREISDWFDWANRSILLPEVPEFLRQRYPADPARAEAENVRMFNLRLLSRMIFVWFMKERDLLAAELLELHDPMGNPRPCLFDDAPDADGFAGRNGYYRGILQNIFFNCLNTPREMRNAPVKERAYDKEARDEAAKAFRYRGKRYLPAGFDFERLFGAIPYLNGGLFDALDEDYAKDEYTDAVLCIPNRLFHAAADDGHALGAGRSATRVRGLNVILADYKFTIEENTPLEEDAALDPELLGMVFENLLAALDSNDENAAKAARKASGSFYTPRRVVDYMVNETLRIYLDNRLRAPGADSPALAAHEARIARLVYRDEAAADNSAFRGAVVDALDALRILDPACGSGAFPMGMLQRIVALLRVVDPDNRLWLERQLARLEPEFRERVRKDLQRHASDYSRKHGIIRNAIHGVDILPMAATITKLRFFISLLVEQKIDPDKPNHGLSPLPNLETKVLCANSLEDATPDLFARDAIEAYRKAREAYFRPGAGHDERERQAATIAEALADMYPQFAEKVFGTRLPDRASNETRNIRCLREWFLHASVPAPFFNLPAFFPDTAEAGGFDIVIGNPPYGGSDITKELQATLGLGSRDPYGAFLARFMGNGYRATPLRPDGVLGYIVSDTFMTIKTHRKLREQLVRHRIHKMIRVHRDTFGATVNTAIVVLQRCQHREGTGLLDCIPPDQTCQMVDLTNVSIHENHERFLRLLRDTAVAAGRRDIATESCAVYHYPQSLIATNSNLPFFVASPKLFALMNDTTAPVTHEKLGGKRVPVRTVRMNGRDVRLVKLGDIAEVVGGVKTYDNQSYVRSTDGAGRYARVPDALIVRRSLTANEQEAGIAIRRADTPHYVDFDKSGEMMSADGRLLNYYKPTEFYIDWSQAAVNFFAANNGLRNRQHYFQPGITYSVTGVYAPTFRVGCGKIFGQKGATLFCNLLPQYDLLGKLCSRECRFMIKNYLSHGVDATDSVIEQIPVAVGSVFDLECLIEKILTHLHVDSSYDYASHEQLEIDRLVYEAYGLNGDDVAAVETWYARRYPKLAAAQRENLRRLGKVEPWRQEWDHYCDESGHLLRDDQPYMALGVVSCPRGERRRLNLAIRELRCAHGIPEGREIKWVGVSPARVAFYIALADLFFDEPTLRGRVLLAPKPPAATFFESVPVESDAEDAPGSVRLVTPAYDEWYYGHYFDLLWETIHPAHRHHFMVDSKDTRGAARVAALQERLHEDLYDYLGHTVPDVTLVDTSATPLSQLCDVLLGAVAFMNQGVGSSPAKRAVARRVAERLGTPLTKATGSDAKLAIRFAREVAEATA
jgi:hypothetical protein